MKGSLEVSVYGAPVAVRPPARGGEPEPARRASGALRSVPVSLGAALLSVLLHVAVLTSMLYGFGGPSRPERPPQAGLSAQETPQSDSALQWIVLDSDADVEPSARESSAPALMALSLQPIPVDLKLPTINASFDPGPLPDDSTRGVAAAGDGVQQAVLYGRYVGQIDARIERAWRRPRTPIGAPAFSCAVRIEQDSRGVVQEVTLEHCNGSELWQHSLVSAIESASPLPAPPDPTVFTRILHLRFISQPYSPVASEEEYEPPSATEPRAATGGSGDANDRVLEALRRALREGSPHRTFSLTLTGSPTEHSAVGNLSAPLRPPAESPAIPSRPPAE